MFIDTRALPTILGAYALSAMLPGAAGAETEAVREIEDRLGQYEARFNRKDPEAISRLFDENVVYYGPLGQVFEGRDAVEQRYRNSFKAGFSEMEVETLEIEVRGDMAWDIARYTVRDPSGKPLAGYHLAVLEKVDGEWIVQRTLVNAVMPQPPE